MRLSVDHILDLLGGRTTLRELKAAEDEPLYIGKDDLVGLMTRTPLRFPNVVGSFTKAEINLKVQVENRVTLRILED